MEVRIKVTDSSGNVVEVVRDLGGDDMISHDFSKMEALVESIRTEALKEVEHEILKRNQAAYVEKKTGGMARSIYG